MMQPKPVTRYSKRRVLAIEPIGNGRVRLRLACEHSVVRRDSYKGLRGGMMAWCPECGAVEKNEEFE